MAKCVNETGEDISTVSFLIDYYKGDKKVATGYAESSMLVKDRVFVVSFEAPSDGWYVPKDEAAAVQVRESACSRIGASGDAGLLEDAGCEAVSGGAGGADGAAAPSAAAVVPGQAAV